MKEGSESAESPMIKLKNGSEVSAFDVHMTMYNINRLKEYGLSGLIALDYLLQICQGDIYSTPDERSIDALQEFSLLKKDRTPTDAIRNIVLSSIRGQGESITVSSPILSGQSLPKPKYYEY